MKKNILIILLIAFLNSLTASIVIPILFVYAETFKLDTLGISLLFAAFPFAQFFAGPYIGKLSDRYGRKPLLVVSLFGTVLSNVLSALAGTGFILIIARLLDGATGGNISVAKAVISDEVPPEDRTKFFGLFGAMFGLGFLIGPILSVLAQQISLPAVYWTSAILATITTIVTMIFLKETHSFDEVNENIFVTKKSSVFTDIYNGIKNKKIGLFMQIEFLVALCFFILTFAFQPYILNVLNKTELEITLLLIVIGIVSFIVQGFLSRIFYRRLGLFNSLALSISTQTILFFILGNITSYSFFVVATGIWALFNSLYRPILSSIISNKSEKNELGKNLGLNESFFGMGQFLGPIIGGIVFTLTKSYSAPFFLSGFLLFFVFIFIVRSRKKFLVE